MPHPDRLERLTDLVLVLLHARQPLSLEEIARTVPGYPEGRDARRQAFERDKRLLRAEGVPVATEPLSGAEQYGYRIDAEALYLPGLQLQPDEQAALHLAVAGVHLGDPSGRHALLKLGATGLAEVRPVASLAPLPALVPLFDAVRRRAAVSFDYRGQRRTVAAGRLQFRRGRWYLTGWDAGRRSARTFRVDRMEDTPTVVEDAAAVLPEGFEAMTATLEEPWRPGEGDPGEVLVAVDAREAWRVVEEVGQQAVAERHEDGSVVLRLGVSSPAALRSWVLGLLDHAEVLGPLAFRDSIVAWLEATAAGAGAGRPDSGSTAQPPIGRPPAGGTLHRAAAAPVPAAAPAAVPASATSGRADLGERLRRLLAIVGWLAQVGEAPIAEIARRFDVVEEQLVEELELAACCGVPPYSPDALLEIVVDEQAVSATLPVELSRPRRLTPAEGFALAAAARTILAVPGADTTGALARALAKLDAALGNYEALVVDLDDPSALSAVRQAAAERRRVEIEYHSASSDRTTVRLVDPFGVVSLDGHWYMDGWCRQAGDARRFRVDRIRRLRLLGPQPEGLPPPPSGGGAAFVPGPGAEVVELELDPEAAWVADSVPVLEVASRPGGGQTVRLAVGGSAWLERLLLQVGPHARVVGPRALVDLAATAADRLLDRYRQGASGRSG